MNSEPICTLSRSALRADSRSSIVPHCRRNNCEDTRAIPSSSRSISSKSTQSISLVYAASMADSCWWRICSNLCVFPESFGPYIPIASYFFCEVVSSEVVGTEVKSAFERSSRWPGSQYAYKHMHTVR